jgi:hypothetical protein
MFNEGISHGVNKAGGAVKIPDAELESTVQVAWPPPSTGKATYSRDGRFVRLEPSNPRFRRQADLAADVVKILNGPGNIHGLEVLNRVNIIDPRGEIIFCFENVPVGGHNWKLVERMTK